MIFTAIEPKTWSCGAYKIHYDTVDCSAWYWGDPPSCVIKGKSLKDCMSACQTHARELAGKILP